MSRKQLGGALRDVRIIDLTTVVMGPYATQTLGDFGADVIKVEAPEGDVIRAIAPARSPGMGALFINTNRNKRSLCLDLKRPQGRQVLLRLLQRADVFVSNVRPDALLRLGLHSSQLAANNARLIQVMLTGFGQNGPYAPQPAYDDLIQGATGVSALCQRSDGQAPRYAPLALADRITGLAAVGAICAALFERERSGLGQVIEVPMFETMASFVLGDHLGGLTFAPHADQGGYQRLLANNRRPFATRDGHVCAVVYTDAHWRSLLEHIGMPDLPLRDARFATFASRASNIDHVYGFLADLFKTRTTREWLDVLTSAGVPVAPMHDLQSLLQDPHLEHTGFFREFQHPTQGTLRTTAPPVRWSRTPGGIDRCAPQLGEHSREILAEAGLDADTIAALIRDGVVRQNSGGGAGH